MADGGRQARSAGIDRRAALIVKAAIQLMVRQRLSTHACPREIEFVGALPETPTGKVQRFVLRGEAR